MSASVSQYEKLGVDAAKKDVRQVFGAIVDNEYPNAFVNIITHPTRPEVVCTQHMDGDGSKFVQRLLMQAEGLGPGIIGPAVVDAIEMNLGDIAASGFVDGPVIFTDTININSINVPKKNIMQELANAFSNALDLYRHFGFNIYFLGGETADLPDQVKSVVFDIAVYAETRKSNIISGNVQPGDKIYGFASDGQAKWEKMPNSGLMANGSTLARFVEMHPIYSKRYPYLIRDKESFRGNCTVDSDVAQWLISPTRHWSIVIKMIVEALQQRNIFHMLHGISINTGGGATKICHIGNGIVYHKVMPEPPALFQRIQTDSGESWRNMFEIFNCGVGIDVVGEDAPEFADVLEVVSEQTGVALYSLGFCEENNKAQNKIVLDTPYGLFDDYY